MLRYRHPKDATVHFQSQRQDKTLIHRAVASALRQLTRIACRKQHHSCDVTYSVVAVLAGLAVLEVLAAPLALAAPTGGVVSSGTGSINSGGGTTTIAQGSDKLAINWDSFSIGRGESVNFVQPSSNSVALNRVVGSGASEIYGNLTANGKVFLINPNGILFGSGASVNVGGLVASTLNLSDADFMSGKYRFSGVAGSVVNQGTITAADGGYVALLGGQVSNQGTLVARLGNVALAAGSDVTLDFAGDGLLGVTVNQGALQALAENKQLIRADGGNILLTAKAADSLIQAVVNNQGVIEARTIDASSGRIRLMGDMSNGLVRVGGTLDASAPVGGNGGFIETSAAQVKIDDGARVSTLANAGTSGTTGTWLVDPHDFTVAASGGDISGATLSSNLANTNVALQSSSGAGAGLGDLVVKDNIAWSAGTTLTLTAANNVDVRADITATGNNAGLVINPNTANGGDPGSGVGKFELNNSVITLSGANPYLAIAGKTYQVINDLAGLQAVNGTLNNTYQYYALGSNIDATATAGWNGGLGFVPLGNSSMEFRGIFTGLGHTVTNLSVNRSSSDFSALFGYTSGGSVIRDIGLINANISGYSSVGALVGRSYGEVYNSYASGNVSGHNDVGGLIGQNYTSAINVHSSVNVTAQSTLGGLVGSSSGIISNAYTTGNISGDEFVGGLVGNSSGVISNVYATGDVSGNSYIGGLVGYNVASGRISNAYAAGRVTAAVSYGGGLAGYNGANSSIATSFWLLANTPVGIAGNDGVVDSLTKGLSSAQATSAATYAAAGWDIGKVGGGSSIWRIYEGSTLPLLRNFLKPVTVTADTTLDKTYDGTLIGSSSAYTVSNGAGLLGSLHYASTAKDVGNYSTADNTLAISGLYSTQDGYDISYGAANVRINPANLVVSAGNDSKVADGVAYSGGNGVSYSGFVAGDSTAVLTGALSYGGSAQGALNAGNYNIRPGGLSASNYDLIFVDGVLTLRTPAPPTTIAPGSAVAVGDSRAASTIGRVKGTDSSVEQINAVISQATGKDSLKAQTGDLYLRIIDGGIRLPKGVPEFF
ncbi:filamentous hemagglutinin N-terminal domain-containing protein [Herbaspirillum sp. RV1423]|uniref:two-partner secretion domain-containing protein n=1 Tax=Herbaspirillum sp. RV1423 TaxID=1443993 RepID=UPI0004B56D41|nr:filamentous hemagglutinin N-terminal domain-containing protein [Herbaspirillum sp. RV1423]